MGTWEARGIRRFASVLLVLAGLNGSLCHAAAGKTQYRIYPLRNGVCKIAGHHAFYGGKGDL